MALPLSTEHLIWLVCGAFYLADHLVYCRPHELLLVRQRKVKWSPRLPMYRFLIRDRAYAFLNPLAPWQTVLRANWLVAPHPDRRLRTARRRMELLAVRFLPVRMAGTLSFACLFLLGPAITETRGIGTAIVSVGPMLVVLWLVTCAEVVVGRRVLKTSGAKLAWFLIEGVICPGLMANVWRRLLLMRCHQMDAVEFFAPTLNAEESSDVLSRLEAYLADLEEREAISTADARVFATYRNLLAPSAAASTRNN